MTSTEYLNPIELLNLTGPDPPERAAVRKAYKRFLTELELDGRDDFDYGSSTFTRHDLDVTLEASKEEEWLVAYHYAAQHPALSTFLSTGRFTGGFASAEVNNVRFTPLLKPYFAKAFDEALVRQFKAGRYSEAAVLIDTVSFTQLPLADRHLFNRTHTMLENRVDKYLHLMRTATGASSVLYGEGRKIKTLIKVYRSNFPKEILARLPHYFSSLYNRLAREAFDLCIDLYNHHNRHALVHDLCEELLALPYLNPFMRSELMRISNQAADATMMRSRKHEGPKAGTNWWAMVRLALFVVFILFRIAACAG